MIEIFISYSDDDRNKVRAIEKIINENNKHLHAIIIADRRQALDSLADMVRKGIFECNYFVPIITKSSINAQWINQEIGFAFAAQRKIFPIIEREVINSLKGFINKEIQLPYIFESNDNSRSEAIKFRKKVQLLIGDILIENQISPKKLSLDSLFSGRWKLVYSGIHNGAEEVEISNGKYFAKPINSTEFKHYFDIKDVVIDFKKEEIKFTKVGVLDKRVIPSVLHIIEAGKYYEGTESNLKNKDTDVSYMKM